VSWIYNSLIFGVILNLDLEFISGEFLNTSSIPKDKEYLLKYLKGAFAAEFISYYLKFKPLFKSVAVSYRCFSEQAGIRISKFAFVRFINICDF